VTDVTLASWGRRAAARVIDAFIVLILFAALGTALGVAADDPWTGVAAGILGFYLLEPLYYAIFHGTKRGATPGKQLLGIAVRRADGRPHGFGLAAGRAWLAWLFSWIPAMPLVDYLWPLWDAQNQTLHDKCVGTIVVRTHAASAAAAPLAAEYAPALTAPEPLTAEQRAVGQGQR
jgi:uncharacterized RDD family membrane protein YckC